MWLLHETAQQYGQRPSALLGIQSGWVAYEFDQAVGWFGRYVERHREETKETGPKNKRRTVPRWTMQQILRGDPLSKSSRKVIVLNDLLDQPGASDVIDM